MLNIFVYYTHPQFLYCGHIFLIRVDITVNFDQNTVDPDQLASEAS